MQSKTLITSYHNPNVNQTKAAAERSEDYLAWRVDVAAALAAAGHAEAAELFLNCADPDQFFSIPFDQALPAGLIGVYVCSSEVEHKVKPVVATCQLRICPDCAHRQTARLLDRYVPVLLDLEASGPDSFSVKHITLTTPVGLDDPDCKEQIKKLMQAVPAAFDQVLPKDWRGDQGLLYAFEFGEEGRKLHFHCIFYGQYIPQADLAAAWNTATDGLARVVWIEQIHHDPDQGRTLEQAVAEVAKYATKLAKRDSEGRMKYMQPDQVVKLHEVLTGLRRVRSYGVLYKIEQPEEKPHVCPCCGAAMIRLNRVEWDIWVQTGWLPNEVNQALRAVNLNLILGNNFSNGPPLKTGVLGHYQAVLPGLTAFVGLPAYAEVIKKGLK